MYRLKSIRLYFFSILSLFFLSFRNFYFKSNYYNKKLITYTPERFFYNPSTYLSTSLTTISNDFFKIKYTAPDLLWKIKLDNRIENLRWATRRDNWYNFELSIEKCIRTLERAGYTVTPPS